MPDLRWLLVFALFLTAGCDAGRPASVQSEADVQPPDKDVWWTEATERAGGQERILAPRELRAVLAAGRRFGFDADEGWWDKKRDWVYERILDMDAEDVESNAGQGRKTLQSILGVTELWPQLIESRVANEAITFLLQTYDWKLQDGDPVFLTEDDFLRAEAEIARARKHLARMRADPGYEALQIALERVRGSSLSDYPYVYAAAGPFLIFYCARDLQTIEGEDAERERVQGRREYYRERLEELATVYAATLNDIAKQHPLLWKRHAPKPREIYYQWIFGDREWYSEFLDRLRKEGPESTYRAGFFDRATGWAYLFEPPALEKGPDGKLPDDAILPEMLLRESMAYLGARQMLHRWAIDPKDTTQNHLDRSRAYWLKEGWPSWVAARQVKKPSVGPLLVGARRMGRPFPALRDVVERESRLELWRFQDPTPDMHEDEDTVTIPLGLRRGFTDLSWALVRHLQGGKHRAAFERYLLSQIDGTKHGQAWLEECFGLGDGAGWKALERAVYRKTEKE